MAMEPGQQLKKFGSYDRPGFAAAVIRNLEKLGLFQADIVRILNSEKSRFSRAITGWEGKSGEQRFGPLSQDDRAKLIDILEERSGGNLLVPRRRMLQLAGIPLLAAIPSWLGSDPSSGYASALESYYSKFRNWGFQG